ncbi:glycosyl transferase [Ancylobacter defluvii]|uniref:Glycosyl transferase n=1 Tax=Ancylobacter defluvii TaxID=1282440 RepID=A0A9W6JWR4_9HYPH|nr:glycosyl transferase [Ancylobacter defluvii]GLK85305.1 glycosyl transferase [Ancylobacter defluvii]
MAGRVISVVIPTRESGNLLIPTLAALVPGAAAGLVREVLLVDGAAHASNEIAEVADAAGCEYLAGPADRGARLRLGAQAARGPWLMFLEPAGLLQEGWTREVRSFIDQAERTGGAEARAASFRPALDGFGLGTRFKETATVLWQVTTGRARPEQGLLIHQRLYQRLGGHADGEWAPQRLVGRIGRGRMVLLRSHMLLPAA